MTPTLHRALVKHNYIPPPRREYRIAATVDSAERQQAARNLAAQHGMSWTEFVNALLDGELIAKSPAKYPNVNNW